jgi:two-component system invasion response regulator UvrY
MALLKEVSWGLLRKNQDAVAGVPLYSQTTRCRTHTLIPRPGSVLIVDCYPLIRLGLKSLLTHFCQCQRIGEADAQSLATELDNSSWNLVVLGWAPGQDGMELLKVVKAQQPSARVLIVGGYSEPEYAVKAMRAGASGYVQRVASTNEILKAVSLITAGESHVYPALPLKLAVNNGDRLPHEKLSGREHEVFMEMITGKRICEIATGLKINAKTVSTYRGRAMSKMGMTSDADLIAYAIRHSLK